MPYPSNIREEELKNRVADDFFGKYGCNDIIKNIDFALIERSRNERQYLLLAEAKKNANTNASLYDIREHFQGRNSQGKMNNKSDDEKYNELIGDLRAALKELAKNIEPKVYEYGFLRG